MKQLFVRIGKHLLYLLFFSALFSFSAVRLSQSFPDQSGIFSIAAAILFLYAYLLRLRRCKRHHRLKTYMTVSLSTLCLFTILFAAAWKFFSPEVFDGFFYVTRVFEPLFASKKMVFGLFFGILLALTLLFPPFRSLTRKLSDALANLWMRLFHLKKPFYLSHFLRRLVRPVRLHFDFFFSNRFWKLFALELFLLLLFSSLISSLGYLILTEQLLKSSRPAKIFSIFLTAVIFIIYFVLHLARYAGLHRRQTYYRVCVSVYIVYAALDFLLFALTSVTVNHYFYFVSHFLYYYNRDVLKLGINKYLLLLIHHLLMFLLIPLVRTAVFRYASYAANKDPLWMRFDKFTDRIAETLEHPTIAISNLNRSQSHHHHHHHHSHGDHSGHSDHGGHSSHGENGEETSSQNETE